MEPPADSDTLLSNRDGFHGTEYGPVSQCLDGLTREGIVAAAIADARRGTACAIIVLETDLNNSVRLHYARVKLEFDNERLDELAGEMMIGTSKAAALWKVANHPGYIERIWKKVEADRAEHAKRAVEFRAKGWKQYFYWLLKKDGVEPEKKIRSTNKPPELSVATLNQNSANPASAANLLTEQLSVAETAESTATILTRVAARERDLEQSNTELAAARAEIVRLNAEIASLRHQAAVTTHVERIADRQVANDIGPVTAKEAPPTPTATPPDLVAADQQRPTDVAIGTAEPLLTSYPNNEDGEPPRRGRERPRVHPAGKKLSPAQRAALEIAETRSTVKWDDDVHGGTKRALVKTMKFVNFDDDSRPTLTEAGRATLDQTRNGGSPRPLA
jgi:hypothetical protein